MPECPSPDNSLKAVLGEDKSLRLIDAATGKAVFESDLKEKFNNVEFKTITFHEGKYALIAVTNDNKEHTYDLQTKKW
eukprot:CAMPEP_0170171232 /NCGR_PEP_ID=MMETSP0040_2-20121228/4344_1 /TAXON_ID=641309 /ORGANISM="Lotharella oceanica, Strain CCMP622" /LENGTH=77 /DNA_ID=CAMNT_0010411165 /DNA_START=41 /DNA_END=271 /DNA_ORIENTATION=+